MNEVSGKCHFRGLAAPKSFDGFPKKCTVDYVIDPTPRANVRVIRFKGGVFAEDRLTDRLVQ